MDNLLDEIKKLRKDKEMVFERSNNDRYRIVCLEKDGSKTAYCFSTSIYNDKTRKLLDLKFHKNNMGTFSVGSNSEIFYSNIIKMQNHSGVCNLFMGDPIKYYSEKMLVYGNNFVYPTTNGLIYKAVCKGNQSFSFDLQVENENYFLRSNDKYFALMSERFKPFVTVSCIGVAEKNNNIISPAKITFQKLNGGRYRITIIPCSPMGTWLLFEINLYEPKLFQDTTVESKNTKTNNAFGGTAFLGNTAEYGEQWLYSRWDFSKMLDFSDKKILKAVLHLPKHNCSNTELSAYKVDARFCSFGSTWSNKISASSPTRIDSLMCEGYQNIDITTLLADKVGRIVKSEGIVIKPNIRHSGFSAVSTGDSYYAPQILEINFR